jgi:hypothetical protein
MPNLTGYAPLDVAIGLVLVYLLFSVLCSAVQEAIASVLGWRADYLEKGLRNLLDDNGGKGQNGAPAAVPEVGPITTTEQSTAQQSASKSAPPTASATSTEGGQVTSTQQPASTVASRQRKGNLTDLVLGHGLLRTTYRGKNEEGDSEVQRRGPSYMSPKLFALALLDVIAPEGKGDDPIGVVKGQIELAELPATVKDALLSMANGAAKDRDELRELVEYWFNSTMERVSGWYKRKAQLVICVLSVVVAVGLNVNTIGIGERLAKDGTVRAAVVAQAEETKEQPEGLKVAAREADNVAQLGVPIGWNKTPGDPARANFDSFSGGMRTVFGWLLTAIALSLGAPFWFGLLGKLTSLRGSGGTATAK